jgi:hypothetical protein
VIKALLARLQLRLTLDAEMGDFFVWLVALPVKVRAREVIAMARIGWAVTHGVRVDAGAAAAASAPMLRAVAAPPANMPVADAVVVSGGPSRKAAVATFGRSFITARPPT